MKTNWALASYEASKPTKWLDKAAIVVLAAAALLAALGWLIFDGTRAL
jgi:hypothetical protein